ncbi:MAG: hypothetical protein EPN93_14465 [Spirochaetes bacterium]|nr:MAG: hypothetical protein EPN93_14465 [Spirochaetota bacterium]
MNDNTASRMSTCARLIVVLLVLITSVAAFADDKVLLIPGCGNYSSTGSGVIQRMLAANPEILIVPAAEIDLMARAMKSDIGSCADPVRALALARNLGSGALVWVEARREGGEIYLQVNAISAIDGSALFAEEKRVSEAGADAAFAEMGGRMAAALAYYFSILPPEATVTLLRNDQ